MKRLVAFATRLLVVTLSAALAVVPTLAAAEEPAFGRTSGQLAGAIAGSPERAASFHAFSQLTGAEQRALTPLTNEQLATIEGGLILLVPVVGLVIGGGAALALYYYLYLS